MSDDRQFYTVKEFCRRNSIGKTTFYELVKAGIVETIKVSTRKTLISASSENIFREKVSALSHKISHKCDAALSGKQRTMADALKT